MELKLGKCGGTSWDPSPSFSLPLPSVLPEPPPNLTPHCPLIPHNFCSRVTSGFPGCQWTQALSPGNGTNPGHSHRWTEIAGLWVTLLREAQALPGCLESDSLGHQGDRDKQGSGRRVRGPAGYPGEGPLACTKVAPVSCKK